MGKALFVRFGFIYFFDKESKRIKLTSITTDGRGICRDLREIISFGSELSIQPLCPHSEFLISREGILAFMANSDPNCIHFTNLNFGAVFKVSLEKRDSIVDCLFISKPENTYSDDDSDEKKKKSTKAYSEGKNYEKLSENSDRPSRRCHFLILLKSGLLQLIDVSRLIDDDEPTEMKRICFQLDEGQYSRMTTDVSQENLFFVSKKLSQTEKKPSENGNQSQKLGSSSFPSNSLNVTQYKLVPSQNTTDLMYISSAEVTIEDVRGPLEPSAFIQMNGKLGLFTTTGHLSILSPSVSSLSPLLSLSMLCPSVSLSPAEGGGWMGVNKSIVHIE